MRLVELDGKPQPDVRISFAAPITAAREVNGQEQPVGPATVTAGALVTSFSAYQPRTFALRLAAPTAQAVRVRSTPVALHYDIATASNDGDHSTAALMARATLCPPRCCPQKSRSTMCHFNSQRPRLAHPTRSWQRDRRSNFQPVRYNRVYILAASADGDQKATFDVGNRKVELNIQDWGGFIGQWDDRQWSSKDTSHDNYGEMTGLKPGYIKRADLAWYCDHHHNAAGENVAYAYSYLFGYAIDLPPGAKTIKLPDNDKIRILAISVANENPGVTPAQPLYDVLPSPSAGPGDFTLSASSTSVSVPQGRTTTTHVIVMPRGGFTGDVQLKASGLPDGVTASFNPSSTAGTSTMTLTASGSTIPRTSDITITGTSGNLSHAVTASRRRYAGRNWHCASRSFVLLQRHRNL